MIEHSLDLGEKNNPSIRHWIERDFSLTQQERIYAKIGQYSFYKSYDDHGIAELTYFEFICDSFRDKKNKDLHQHITEKFKDFARKNYDCNPDQFVSDVYYRVWFEHKENNLKRIDEIFGSGFLEFIKWSCVPDNMSPEQCKKFDVVFFSVSDPQIMDLIDQHWRKINVGCRCHISGVSKRTVQKPNYINRIMRAKDFLLSD